MTSGVVRGAGRGGSGGGARPAPASPYAGAAGGGVISQKLPPPAGIDVQGGPWFPSAGSGRTHHGGDLSEGLHHVAAAGGRRRGQEACVRWRRSG